MAASVAQGGGGWEGVTLLGMNRGSDARRELRCFYEAASRTKRNGLAFNS